MSAVDLAALEKIGERLDALSGLVADDMAAELDIVAAMREATQHFGMGGDPDYPVVDLVDFLERYASNRTNPLVLDLLGESLASLDAAIAAECHGSLVPYAQGLSVYFPKTAADCDATYRACGLDWTALTQWDELLLAFYAAQERAAAVEIVAGPSVRCAPSPFRETTRVRFAAAAAGPARLRVFDAAGRLVRRLHEGPLPAGDHDFVWDGRDAGGRRLPAGVYLAVAETGGRRMAGKVLLLR
ncbi:MAG: hypothetical protein JW819_10265 [Candidatus Krumholzibacteriota bacterium]|nr:hypothetical protein [Candidatus Krumholzibacteriota bacterium]